MEEHKLSKLQIAEFEIFKVFIGICDKYNFRYYVSGGTQLGAVRHKGFIPWDDDIDVGMPRPDFEKFLEIAPKELPEHLYLSTYKRPDHITLVAMIFNKKKEFKLINAEKEVQTGAWIDILVIDGAPGPGIKRKIFGIKYMFYRMMNQYAHFSEIVNMTIKRPWYEALAIKFAQWTNIEKHLDPVKWGDRMHKFLQTYPFETSDYAAEFLGREKMREIVPKDWFGKGTDYDFEDIKVKGFDKAHEYLTHYYGDYMTPPPMADRDRHGVRDGE
ncbi:MAG: LicD family protein [Prevotella sp.]|nr:LicD family protein [Prevotella sp.]